MIENICEPLRYLQRVRETPYEGEHYSFSQVLGMGLTWGVG